MSQNFTFAGRPVPFESDDDVLTALMRSGVHPTGGGVLCGEGDCSSCVAEVDGVAYVRTCQTPATVGLRVRAHPDGAPPSLPASPEPAAEVVVRNVHVDVVVIGAGRAGQAAAAEAETAGESVEIYDAARGEEAIGVFPGPMVAVRTRAGMVHAHSNRVVIATGRAAVLPACPGAQLAGIVTAAAGQRLADAGVDLGHTVVVTQHPERFDGHDGKLTAVVTDSGSVVCDTAIVDLGTVPRNQLARIGHGLPVEVVGGAAEPPDPVPCPSAGVVCPCNGTTVEELDEAIDRGFADMELLKRATLAGTGTCQGSTCMPHLKAFLAERTGAEAEAFTARPVARQLTLAEVSAGRNHPVFPRTALHDEHVRRGATMDRIGGWWRPWTYGDTDAECATVRAAVSVGDVSTLGKMLLSGPDAEAALQRLVPTDVATIAPGRSRYVLMLDERGYVVDDGMICREVDGARFYVTFTSGGASFAEMWVRDWTADLDVRWMNVTSTFGAINVTGPRSGELMSRMGLASTMRMLDHREADIGGVPCRVVRLSFTGEQSYELHHPVGQSAGLWNALLDAGADLGIQPHGLDALTRLRLEKGHLIVGQDTDYDSSPRRLDHQWAVNMDKGDFVGRHALTRTNQIPLDKQLVGLTVAGSPPHEGSVLTEGDRYAGYVTSSGWSDELGRSVMMAWLFLHDGVLPDQVTVDGRSATRQSLPFIDPEGARARA